MYIFDILVALIFLTSSTLAKPSQESNVYGDNVYDGNVYGDNAYGDNFSYGKDNNEESKSETEENAEIDEMADRKFTSAELQMGTIKGRFNSQSSSSETSNDDDDNAFIALLENAEMYQGDIIIKKKDSKLESGIIDENYRWPKDSVGKVVVPYEISSKYCKL